MSLGSELAAEHHNKIKESWVKELNLAYERKDWDAVKTFLDKLEKFYFSG